MSPVDDGLESNPTTNPRFSDILDAAVARRTVLIGGVAAATASFLGGATGAHAAPRRRELLGFPGIPVSSADAVVVPEGYTAKVLISWGDPLSDGPAFAPDASNSAADQEQQWGMHNDAVWFFPLDEKGRAYRGNRRATRGLLVQNHEYTDDVLLFTDGTANWTAEKTAKSQAAHGVSVIELRLGDGGWEIVRPSSYARRVTAYTPIDIAGPAAGDPELRTSADPSGTRVLGTFNNCAFGHTPWNTYLACEENFNGYFLKTGAPTADETRYGIGSQAQYLWHTTDSRFSVDAEPNEPNRFGWVTEIDPFDPGSTPVKRTALGRIKHEGSWVVETKKKRVVVYSGDDQNNEYIYRYVSDQPWDKAFKDKLHPLDHGVLYAGRFDADGTGEWLALTIDDPALQAAGFTSQADVLIRARQAADVLGATKMDRPEWIDVDTGSGFVYCTLTNNSTRGTATPVDAANPRPSNVYGHIIRWQYRDDYDEPTFRWEIFALAGDPADPTDGSTIVGDKYGSPDGIYVSPQGRLWIQTDVSSSTVDTGAYAGFGNNQMLAADPDTRETRRFLVGPNGCEITGVVVTPDERTMFVGIQHPGEAPSGANDPANPGRFSTFPGGAGTRPRSSTMIITKDDGGEIGS
jgi:secreted PhoX family phosphatase